MNSNKRVTHMTTVHHPYDTRIYHKECQSLQKAGYNVTLIAPHEKGLSKKGKINIIPIKKYRNRFLRMFLSTFQAYKEACKLNAHYYHIHDPELLPVAWLLKKKNNVVIYDIHEDYKTSIMQKSYMPKPIRKLCASTYQVVEKFLSRNLELCLAEKYYKNKYPEGKCVLNYPLLNKRLINHEIDYESRENKLVYTGNVTIDRGAFIHARLPLIDPSITVHFIGKFESGLDKRMKEIAGDKNNHLIMKGVDRYVPREEIDEGYVNHSWLAGLALFPPTAHYMQKELTKFFEYMSVGIPILCSDIPAWKHFVEKYSCGIAVDPYNDKEIKHAIEFLKENPGKAKEMGNNGKRAVLSKLNWKVEEEKLINWYNEIGRIG